MEWLTSIQDWIVSEGYETYPFDIHLFGILEDIVRYDREQYRSEASQEEVLERWRSDGSPRTYSNPAAILVYTSGPFWDRTLPSERAFSLAHEWIHMVQVRTAAQAGISDVPAWFYEGQAQFLANLWETHWGGEPAFLDVLILCGQTWTEVCENLFLTCDYPLADLHHSRDFCEYIDGPMALALLHKKYGERSMNVWKGVETGREFSQAFQDVYGISVDEFYDLYEMYKLKGFPDPVPTSDSAAP